MVLSGALRQMRKWVQERFGILMAAHLLPRLRRGTYKWSRERMASDKEHLVEAIRGILARLHGLQMALSSLVRHQTRGFYYGRPRHRRFWLGISLQRHGENPADGSIGMSTLTSLILHGIRTTILCLSLLRMASFSYVWTSSQQLTRSSLKNHCSLRHLSMTLWLKGKMASKMQQWFAGDGEVLLIV